MQGSAAVFGLPLTHGFSAGGSFERSDKPDASQEPEAGLRVITPDYFQVMGIALHSGRPFKSTDDSAAPGVAIINEEAASRYWPGENPVGKQLRLHISLVGEKTAPRTIVGVVKNVRYEALDADIEPEIFIPHAQHPVNEMTVVVRANPSLQGMSAMIRGEVRAMDPLLPVWAYQTMDELVGASMAERRFTMMLLACFAGLALLLAAVGIYGVLSYTVAQRTREIGLRMAVGARRSDVIGMFFKEGTRVLLLGLSAGLVGGFAVTRLLASLLFGVHTVRSAHVYLRCLPAQRHRNLRRMPSGSAGFAHRPDERPAI